MIPSDNCLALISHYEGKRLTAYQDSVGVWTIGVGHTHGVKKADIITIDQMNAFLRQDIQDSVDDIEALNLLLNQNQFDALVSFTFNLGIGNLKRSQLLLDIKNRNYDLAADQFQCWVSAGGKKLSGLVDRRQTEALLFSTGELKFFNS